ncbi:MAG TPA: type II toxin-antitoxin system VapC family toxin [Xanthobacteraceae bacterium]|nr:type II toxin-antitoxin system VapC family toxin [Xanthobacteraceae bacterium]
MKVLIDTHTLFWWVTDDPKLSSRAREILLTTDNEVLVSAATAWELATKARFGKWPQAAYLAANIKDVLDENAFAPLAITIEHARIAGSLAVPHRDPFDRMLAAQAQVEGISLVTADPVFGRFGTPVLW